MSGLSGPSLPRRAPNTLQQQLVWLLAHSGPVRSLSLNLVDRLIDWRLQRRYGTARPNPVLVEGLRLYHDGHAFSVRGFALGRYEPGVTRLFKDLVKPGMTVLDVGANIGYFSLLAARLLGEAGTVWAFEPVPTVAALLRRNVVANGCEDRVHVVAEAVCDQPGAANLYVHTTARVLSSLYEEVAKHPDEAGPYQRVEVPCTTLDAWGAQQGWPRVDLVKMDIEGAEKAALEGMVGLSQRNAELRLIVEFNVRCLEAAGVSAAAFAAALRACGFGRVFWIGGGLRRVDLPADVPWLLHAAPFGYVNLLCEKGD